MNNLIRGKLGCSRASGTMGTRDWKAARILSFSIWNLCFPPHHPQSQCRSIFSIKRKPNVTQLLSLSLSSLTALFLKRSSVSILIRKIPGKTWAQVGSKLTGDVSYKNDTLILDEGAKREIGWRRDCAFPRRKGLERYWVNNSVHVLCYV